MWFRRKRLFPKPRSPSRPRRSRQRSRQTDLSMSRLATFATFGRRVLPNHWDVIALAAILVFLVGVARAFHGIAEPLTIPNPIPISLSVWDLPYYALRTTLRMFAALAVSLVFTFTYATLAAKSRRAEMVLIPLLDILQSVPILGFL